MKLVREIIERKIQGIDCTEEESAEIKGWVKETIILLGSDEPEVLRLIQTHFPIEYGEALDEMEKNINKYI